MKILLIHKLTKVSDDQVTFGAIPYYRMQKPLQVLNRLYPEIDYTTLDNIENVEDSFLKDFNLILFCREIKNPDATKKRLDKLGIPFGLDLDDYWHLDRDHVLYTDYIHHNVPALVVKSIHAANFVTCTTGILAEKIRPINPNVHIIPNGIDTEDPAWQPNKIKSERLRYGFTQGSTHFHDLLIVSDQVKKSLYDPKFYHKCQIALCFKAEWNQPSIYIAYERILTDDHKTLKFFPHYSKDLKLLSKPNGDDKPYKQIWFRDVDIFGTVYDEMDCVVAPLRANEFNACKSNLKMLEAGFKDCAVMVSAVDPYLPLANSKNSFLLSERNFFEWQRYIHLNPSILEDKKEQLKEDVRQFDLKNLTVYRKQLYEQYQ
jgi:hypothetical protein